MNMRGWVGLPALLLVAACGADAGGAGAGQLAGAVSIDGSSTVYPLTEAVAEDFIAENGGRVRVTVGVSGTGGGFKRFCAGETDISNASRHIKDVERQACEQAGVRFLEIPVAYDGIAIVVHPDNPVECLTVEELRRVWEPGSRVSRWSDVRLGLQNLALRLYGPGTDSGTFDYFTEAVMGRERASRPDYTASEDDNVLVQGVAGDQGSLGYFGYAYYEENRGRIRAVAVDGGSGCVQPTPEAIRSGTYAPLSRPVFIYVRESALERSPVREFVRFYLAHADELARQVGFVGLEEARYREGMQLLETRLGDED
jgi:phosphate transport system substrate-binding protein